MPRQCSHGRAVPKAYLEMDLLVGLEVAEVHLLQAEGCVQRRFVDVEEPEQLVPTALVVDLKYKGFLLASQHDESRAYGLVKIALKSTIV